MATEQSDRMTHPEALVEAVAEAMHKVQCGCNDGPDELNIRDARAVLDLFDVREEHRDIDFFKDTHRREHKFTLTTAWEDADVPGR